MCTIWDEISSMLKWSRGGDVSRIVDMKFVELKYGRALLLEWHANFNDMEEDKKIGNPRVISMLFPNLPR